MRSGVSVGKASIAVISLTLLLLMTVLAAWLTSSYHTAVQRGDERVTAAAKIVAANANWLNSLARETLHRIDDSLGPKIPASDENRIHDLNSAVADLPTLVTAYVVSADGKTIFSNNRAIQAISATDRDYFIKLKNGAEEYTSAMIVSRVTQRQIFVFSRRLERNGDFAGIAVIAFDATILRPVRDAVDLGANSTVSLIRRDGQLVARSPEPSGPVNMRDYVLFTNYMRKATSGVYRSSSPVDHEDRVVAYRIIERTPFVAVVSADIDVIMRPFWNDLRTATLLITLAIGGAIAAAWWITSLIKNDALHMKQLAAALQSNQMLMREIHHRVKNNMQTVMALVRMQGFDAKDIAQLNDRILAMSAVHEQMYGFDQFSGVSARHFIPGFVKKLVDVHGRDVTTEFDIDNIVIAVQGRATGSAKREERRTAPPGTSVPPHFRGREWLSSSVSDSFLLPNVFDHKISRSFGDRKTDTSHRRPLERRLRSEACRWKPKRLSAYRLTTRHPFLSARVRTNYLSS